MVEQYLTKATLEASADRMPFAIYIVQGRKIGFTNKKFQDISGYSSNELVGADPVILVHKEDTPLVKESRAKMLTGRRKSPYAYRLIGKDGDVIWVIETCAYTRYQSSKEYIGCFVHLSEQKGEEQRLRAREALLNDLIESTTDMVWEVDANCVHRYASKKVKDILGYEAEEIVGKTPYELMPLETVESFKKEWSSFWRSRKPLKRLRNTMLHKDGRWIVMETNAVPFFAEDGSLLGYRGFDHEVTKQLQAEEALRHSEERFRSMTENIHEIVWEVDPEANITYVNPRIKDILGYEPSEVIGASADTLYAKKQRNRTAERFLTLINSHKPFTNWENYRAHKDGRTVVVQTSGAPFFNENGQLLGYRGTDRDITEEKQLRENMEFYIRDVTNAQEEERKRIARELHDETSQSLVGLAAKIGAVRLKSDSPSTDLNVILDDVLSDINSVIEDIRRICNALRPGLLDRFGLVAALQLLCDELEEKHGLTVQLEVSGCEKRISADVELALFRIVQESLNNTIQHGNATEAKVELAFDKDRVSVRVIDDGHGFQLPEEVSTFARQGKLGLMNMVERSDLLGSVLSIESKPGKGTIVSVVVPVN